MLRWKFNEAARLPKAKDSDATPAAAKPSMVPWECWAAMQQYQRKVSYHRLHALPSRLYIPCNRE